MDADKKTAIPNTLRPWIEARHRFRLPDAHVQMARELGLNPQKLGKIDNHRQEPRKAPLPAFIEELNFRRFGKRKPDHVRTIEEIAAAQRAKKQARKAAKSMATAVGTDSPAPDGAGTQPNGAAARN